MILSVIIPVYHEDMETIMRAVNSITCQHNYSPEEIEIILSSDEPKRKFEEFASIPVQMRIIYCTENRGPGIARQRGIESASGDYVTFIDADDFWYNLLAWDLIRKRVTEDPSIDYIKFPMLEETQQGFFCPGHDSTWCFSKVYRKAFLEEHHIAFDPEYRVHEDSFFVRMLELEKPNTIEHQDMIYLWTNNANSTVRQNDGIYWQTSFPVYLDVCFRVLAKKNELGMSNTKEYLYNICHAYANICRMDEEYRDLAIAELKKHCDTEDVAMIRMMEQECESLLRDVSQLPNLPTIMPKFTFEQFLQMLV